MTHWGLSGEIGEEQWRVGSWGEIAWGEMPDIGDGGMEAANHIAMYVPMQQSCIISTGNPEPKAQLKKKGFICSFGNTQYVLLVKCVLALQIYKLFLDQLLENVHVKNMQDCCIGTYMAMWFAAFLPITYI